MRTKSMVSVWLKRRTFLLASLMLLPPLAFAGLATTDLAGTNRSTPPTMGALEVAAVSAGVAAPLGLMLTVARTDD